MGIGHAAPSTAVLATLCGSGDFSLVLGVAGALFAAALFGGFAHCAPMCGPFVVMQIAGAGREARTLRRLTAGAVPGYHLGRMTTYVALGAAVGGVGGSIVHLTGFRWLFAVLLAAAALCFLLQAVRRIVPSGTFRSLGELWGHAVGRIAMSLLRQRASFSLGGYGLGLVLGLLPCGFLYAALIAAAASGGAAAGALAMAGFALGTVPSLVAVGLLGSAALRRWRGLAGAIAAPVFLLNAMTLATLAARMIA